MSAYHEQSGVTIYHGDCREVLKKLPEASVNCCVTSPPYWGLRDYGVNGQIGLEPSPQEWVEQLAAVFSEVWRLLRDDGTLWLNLGDAYASAGDCGYQGKHGQRNNRRHTQRALLANKSGLAAKNLLGLPWRVALALQADGWILRSDVIWHKPNPMPESVTDRPTKSHEYIFLLAKSERYYYDADAIKENASDAMLMEVAQGYQGHFGLKDYEAAGVQNPSTVKERIIVNARKRADAFGGNKHNGETTKRSNGSVYTGSVMVNKRTVWTVPTSPYKEAHFATYPKDLIKPCILAGCRSGGTVLDPFAGSGTTGIVATELSRKAILIELNADYAEMARQRCNVTPGLAIP